MATEYTFSEDLYSDLHKEAYGFRPTNDNFSRLNDDQKQATWDCLNFTAEEAAREAREFADGCVAQFKGLLETIQSVGAEDEQTALRWITKEETFYSVQCIEHYVYNLGFLFTEFGAELVVKMTDVVTFERVA